MEKQGAFVIVAIDLPTEPHTHHPVSNGGVFCMPVVRQRISREDFRLSHLTHEVEHLQVVVLLLIAMKLPVKTIGSWPVRGHYAVRGTSSFTHFFER